MTSQRVGFEIHEEYWSKICSLVEREFRDLRITLIGEISRIDVRPGFIHIEAEVLAPDGTWEHTNIYERRFMY